MIRVVLVESIVWNNRDQIIVTSDPGALLDSFKQYRPQISTQHDSAMLLTYVIGKIVVLNTIIIIYLHTWYTVVVLTWTTPPRALLSDALCALKGTQLE